MRMGRGNRDLSIRTEEVFSPWRFWLSIWIIANILDTILTTVILHAGGVEVGLSYQISGHNIFSTMVVKYAVVAIVPLSLKRRGMMKYFPYFMLFALYPVVWNVIQLVLYYRG
jgi:hypothetical protein